MYSRIKNVSQRFYDLWMRITGLGENIKLRPINFERPWWAVITGRPFLWVFILSGRILVSIFITLVPQIVGFIIEYQEQSYFYILALCWIVFELWRYVTICYFDKEQSAISYGVQHYAYRFFLTVDPIYHAMRTSGRLFAKIERGARAYENILNVFTYELLPVIVGICTVMVSFFAINLKIGLISFSFLLVLSVFNIFFILLNAMAFEKKLIETDDDVKALNMESLTRIELVRSSFASGEIESVVLNKNKLAGASLATAWISFGTGMLVTRIGYGLSVCTLGLYLLMLIGRGEISTALAISCLSTYLFGSYKIMRIGDKTQKVFRYLVRIKDLFSFIREFGIQSFPVLSDEVDEIEIPETDTISIRAEDLHFYYTKKAEIFDEHTLKLDVKRTQPSKLYGIIGPSGIGKTTLILILGGQLRPTTGEVTINGLRMYEIDDNARSQLVAMQGQTAGNLSGTVRDSLLLGLPKDKELFPDEKLIAVLERVGVWSIFKEKEGLESSVGEGGMNLSVGQRQRLNFVSLYLRTKYFKPSLILIDEPTSSLDEVSEQAITDMIDELSCDSVTFVIAHRLNTLKKAVGILDVSLLAKDKELLFYPHRQLEQKSAYYRQLISGEILLGE